jgi:GNAT superfamily N-acetyltransferase
MSTNALKEIPVGLSGSAENGAEPAWCVDFSTVSARLDRDRLWHELTEHAYWAKYRTRDMFEQQLDSAWRIVGAYRAVDGRMVGFCRAFSDGAAMAYLADVYVSREERGRGIGQGLLRVMIDEGPGRNFRWMLHTADARQDHHPPLHPRTAPREQQHRNRHEGETRPDCQLRWRSHADTAAQAVEP